MDRPDQTLGVVLAAGGSTRMGEPKGLRELGGRPLLARQVEALQAVSDGVIVVLGARARAHRAVLPAGIQVVENPAWRETGPAESLLLALEGRAGGARAVVTPVDVPPAGRAELQRLLAAGPPAVLGWQGRPGHPVLVQVEETREVLRRGGLLRDALALARLVEAEGDAVLRNLNTPADWAAWVASSRP